MKRRLFIMDIALASNMNGVTRHIQELLDTMVCQKSFDITWIRFTNSVPCPQRNVLQGYVLIQYPLPPDIKEFLGNAALRNDYWAKTFDELADILNGSPASILHLHTLNLMEFALYAQSQISCRIVSHVHCIPWKGLYNTNRDAFNKLYQLYYIEKNYSTPQQFVFRSYEKLAYTKSDLVVCVTECARDFIQRMFPNCSSRLCIVRNGVRDMAGGVIRRPRKRSIRCLFVGSAHHSKGLDYVLQALQALLMIHDIQLTIAGGYSEARRREIKRKYPFLTLQFKGIVTTRGLRALYANSDIGIIGSLQEQCSYVAIEMMMFGLPVVTTDVDGLCELFDNEENVRKVQTIFHPKYGLRTDVVQMAESIAELIQDPQIREQMGQYARASYLNKYTAIQMAQNIKRLFDEL